jgi:hypothetical protein
LTAVRRLGYVPARLYHSNFWQGVLVTDRKYVAPQVKDYGTLSALTAASAAGTHTDATFPAGTPILSLTFS